MNLTNKAVLTIIFFALLFSLANAQVLVGLAPKDEAKESISLYPEEVLPLELTVFNAGNAPEEISLKILASEPLAFIENGNLQQSIGLSAYLLPNEKQALELQLTALQESNEQELVSVAYGSEEYGFSFNATANVLPASTVFDSTEPAIGGNSGSFIASVKNQGNTPLQNIKLEIIPQIGIESSSEPFLVSVLLPNETAQKNFSFFIDSKAFEAKTIVLQLSFSDTNGFHIMQRQLTVQKVPYSDVLGIAIFVLLLIVGVYALLQLIAFLKRTNPEKKEEKKEEKK